MYQAAQNRYQVIPYRRCGASGLMLPAVSLGLWHNFGDTAPYENMRALCRTAFDHGITHFDLANNYGPEPGAAERNFGKILRDDLGVYRDELIISTKAGYLMWDGPYGDWGSRKYLLASLDQSLQRMGLDYVDIFYHHRMDPNTPLEETMGALAQAVRSGKALYAGLSNYDGPTPHRRAVLEREGHHAGAPCADQRPERPCPAARSDPGRDGPCLAAAPRRGHNGSDWCLQNAADSGQHQGRGAHDVHARRVGRDRQDQQVNSIYAQ